VTNLNERSVWSQLKDGKSARDICEMIPDEWHDWVVDVAEVLYSKYNELENEVTQAYVEVIHDIPAGFSRKEFALAAKKTPYMSYLFALLDCKSISDMLWDAVKPDVNNK
jgi:RNA ligase